MTDHGLTIDPPGEARLHVDGCYRTGLAVDQPDQRTGLVVRD